MSALDINSEGSLDFMAERLNRDPIVMRGLASDEVLLAAGVGVLLGIPIGLLLWLVTGQLGLLATAILLFGPFITLFFGGALLRRLKRGKPDTWVYRLLQFKAQRRFGLVFGQKLMLRSGYWTIVRTIRFWPKRLRLMTSEQESRHEPV